MLLQYIITVCAKFLLEHPINIQVLMNNEYQLPFVADRVTDLEVMTEKRANAICL